MDLNKLKTTVATLLNPTRGILAADESPKTIQKRFDKIGLKSSPQINLSYRMMLFSTPGVEDFISGVILHDETIRQEADGVSIPKYLEKKGIVPGIKVDKGVVDLPNFPGEKITEGLDGLSTRLEEYVGMGAKFTKWRAVITIGSEIPTETCLDANGEVLARYAAIVQNLGMVPIIEPEVLRDGDYDLEKCKEVSAWMLKRIFQRIASHKVSLEGLILKTNMATCGEDNPKQASPEEVAKVTMEIFNQALPKNLGGIVFLSGGQSPEMATENLNAIEKLGPPAGGWPMSFSYARALQGEAMELWQGKEENLQKAQKAFSERGKKVALARQGLPARQGKL